MKRADIEWQIGQIADTDPGPQIHTTPDYIGGVVEGVVRRSDPFLTRAQVNALGAGIRDRIDAKPITIRLHRDLAEALDLG